MNDDFEILHVSRNVRELTLGQVARGAAWYLGLVLLATSLLLTAVAVRSLYLRRHRDTVPSTTPVASDAASIRRQRQR